MNEELLMLNDLPGGRAATDRSADTTRFYDLLDRLDSRIGGARTLADCHGRARWPARGVYFFRESGESRSGSGQGPRVVRVGTHALKVGSRATLWQRLSQHRSGSHRGSIFRSLAGVALARHENLPLPPSWGVGSSASAAACKLSVDRAEIKQAEADLEARVSLYIGAMPFLWLHVDDEPGPNSQRAVIESYLIRLLSGYRDPTVDSPSPDWLGRCSDRERVRRSGLWNNDHVDRLYGRSVFLDAMERWIDRTEPL